MEQNRFYHILNPNRDNKNKVRRIFRSVSIDNYCWVERSKHPTHLETVVEWALQKGRKELAIWGGDGTFSRVVQELYRLQQLQDVIVALIPVGSANDFAKKVGLLPWEKTVKFLFSAKEPKGNFDLGLLETTATKRVFVNNAGFGRTVDALERRTSNPIKDIFGFEEQRLHLEWKTGHIQQYETLRSFLGIIFNGPYFNDGMFFNKEIMPDDGILNGFLVPPQGRMALLWKFMKSRIGFSLSDEKTFRMDGQYISIESDRDLYPQVDGERVSATGEKKLIFSVLPGVLTMAIPSKD